MKKIEAIIRMSKLEVVSEALLKSGVTGMTIYDAEGIGSEKGPTIQYRGSRRTGKFVARTKLEVIVSEDLIDEVIDAIYQNAYTGEIGDGRILVSSLDEVIRVRTGESEQQLVSAATL
jgi:nitrogen regulatory protein P-II 1